MSHQRMLPGNKMVIMFRAAGKCIRRWLVVRIGFFDFVVHGNGRPAC
jgi:hypothetical protein